MLLFFLVSIALSCPEDENEFDIISLSSGISQQEICDQSTNRYELSLSAGEILQVDLLFSHVQGDLDVYLYDMNGLELMRSSTTSSDNERISYRTSENVSLLMEVVHHPSVSSPVESSISYVIDVQMNMGTCEDNWDVWNSENEGDPTEENAQDAVSEMNEPPKWSYAKSSTQIISFSTEDISEIEMMFQEDICLYSEHWYQFEGHIGEVVNFALTHPKQIASDLENSIPIDIEKNHLQAHLFDEDGDLLRIVSFEENDDVYQGQMSIDFISDVANVYVKIFRESDVDTLSQISDFLEEPLSYQLDISREFVSVCVDDEFDGNIDFDVAASINTGSYSLQACTDDYFVLSLEGNYDIRLEHDVEDGELDLILYDDLFNEVSRSVGSTGEEIISLLGEGDVYIQIYLQEDIQTDGVSYTLSIYPTDVTLEEEISYDEDRIYQDTGVDDLDDGVLQKSGCSVISSVVNRIFLFVLSSLILLFRRKI